MHKRPNKRNLNKFLGHEAAPSDAMSSHVYGKVAKQSSALPRAKRSVASRRGVVSGYRDSMVGSTAQYRHTTPLSPKVLDANKKAAQDEPVLGNRPRHDAVDDKKSADTASIDRRQHFIEPPRRGFNPYG